LAIGHKVSDRHTQRRGTGDQNRSIRPAQSAAARLDADMGVHIGGRIRQLGFNAEGVSKAPAIRGRGEQARLKLRGPADCRAAGRTVPAGTATPSPVAKSLVNAPALSLSAWKLKPADAETYCWAKAVLESSAAAPAANNTDFRAMVVSLTVDDCARTSA
jgi:hypothetical protein